MGAWRKAGVWLGLVEDEDDGFFDDEDGDNDDFAVPVRPRPLVRPQRTADRDERDRPVRERLDRDRPVRDRLDRDRPVRDRLDRDRLDRPADRTDRDRLERDRLERDRLTRTSGGRDLRVDPDDPADADLRGARGLRGDREGPTVRELNFGHDRDSRGEDATAARLSSTRLTETRPTDEPRAGRSTVRQFPRPTAGSTALSMPAEEELSLAPQVQLRERAVGDERGVRRYQITTLHPTSYSEARAIGEQFRDGHPVIMNLTEMDEPDAKRLVDFAAGLAFGLRGSMERVTNRVFLLTPPNIRVSDEEKQRIAETGFFDAR
jgi:cell division inhibitor SepF